MDKTKIQELRELAQKATPGPWEANGEAVDTENNSAYNIALCHLAYRGGNWSGTDYAAKSYQLANASFIAAVNPTMVLELLDIAQRAREEAAETACKEINEKWQAAKRDDAMIYESEKRRAEAAEAALKAWTDGTEWVQQEFNGNKLDVACCGMHRSEVIRREIERLRAALASRPAVDLKQIQKALQLAMDICDAVPTRAHKSDDTLLALLGRLVNCQDDGLHGYALIRDTLADVQALLAQGGQPANAAAVPCAQCGGTGVVDDGEIDCYPNGEPYMNGPVKCVKDCPACDNKPAAPEPGELPPSADSIVARNYETDIAHRLRLHATNANLSQDLRDALRAGADESDRFYRGMMAWKDTAQKKDATWAGSISQARADALDWLINQMADTWPLDKKYTLAEIEDGLRALNKKGGA